MKNGEFAKSKVALSEIIRLIFLLKIFIPSKIAKSKVKEIKNGIQNLNTNSCGGKVKK
jgi:hypothetical protein